MSRKKFGVGTRVRERHGPVRSEGIVIGIVGSGVMVQWKTGLRTIRQMSSLERVKEQGSGAQDRNPDGNKR